jgi:hypothetical protein
MEKFQINDKVTWIEELAIVPHPEGKLGSDGNVLPVFRNTQKFGRVIDKSSRNIYVVRPEFAEAYKDKRCGERYYDIKVEESNLSKVD